MKRTRKEGDLYVKSKKSCLVNTANVEDASANMTNPFENRSSDSGLSSTFIAQVKELTDCNKENEMMNRIDDSNGKTRTSATRITDEITSSDGATREAPLSSRVCPFYKRIPDAFSYGNIPDCSAYFLTHFHADHYMGLRSSFNFAPIYCSEITYRLVKDQLRVQDDFLRPLSLHIRHDIDGVYVTLIDANHCPGAVIIVFEVPSGTSTSTHVHCGDFRAIPRHHRLLSHYPIHSLFLDTTYLNPCYCFPPQHEILLAVEELARAHYEAPTSAIPFNRQSTLTGWIKSSTLKEHRAGVLFIVGTYLIGKERVAECIANALDIKIFASARKRRILSMLDIPSINARMVHDSSAGGLHILSMGDLTDSFLSEYLKKHQKHGYQRLVAFRPTGWTFAQKPASTSIMDLLVPRHIGKNITVYGVPYSEHSSFSELEAFILSLNVKRVIPTVNVGRSKERAQMEYWITRWQDVKAASGLKYPKNDYEW